MVIPRPPAISREATLSAAERLSAVCHLIASLEYLASRSEQYQGGLQDWTLIRPAVRARAPWLARLVDVVARPGITEAVHLTRVAAAGALLAPTPWRGRLAANAALTVTAPLLHTRYARGGDGADHASFVVQTAATIARAAGTRPQVTDACLWFVAAQSVLSYTAAGWAKAISPTWRRTEALTGVTRTLTFGDAAVWRFFRDHPHLARLAAHGVVALECGFPAVFALRGRLAPPLLAAMGGFHVANTRIMGLGRFLWAFTAMYPAVLYVTDPRHRDRDDSFVPATATATIAALVTHAVASRFQRRFAAAGHGDEQWLTTSAGNRLAYRQFGPARPTHTLVFVHGLGMTAETWDPIVRILGDRFRVVTYQRAGYGTSEWSGRDGSIDSAITDLIELSHHVSGHSPVTLVGHSLGGYLALRAAAQDLSIAGAVLLDASHPAQLRTATRSAARALDAEAGLRLIAASTRLGLGLLAQRPPWIDVLPPRSRRLATAHHRHSGTWSAALREYRAAVADARAETAIPALGPPLLVLTAEYSESADPAYGRLCDELATSRTGSQRAVIGGADHLRLLIDESIATEVARRLTLFIDAASTARISERRGGHGR
ncbi:alpha/beta fold hydrolase [Nocardia vinacea]|uniref:Alpha/beta fold hydrolase n=1 Tax=Nocardia vinacea TaxID=96468 RepID=A0ABZ1YWG6_9NOCA|nr:alpha/beta fold hydrolase [Nocardia vinacea]